MITLITWAMGVFTGECTYRTKNPCGQVRVHVDVKHQSVTIQIKANQHYGSTVDSTATTHHRAWSAYAQGVAYEYSG